LVVINSPLFGNSPYTMNKNICNHYLKILQSNSKSLGVSPFVWTEISSFIGVKIFYNLPHARGDINSDGNTDISDVILCLRQAIGLDSANPDYSDMNDDGSVDISDVILILRKAIGLD